MDWIHICSYLKWMQVLYKPLRNSLLENSGFIYLAAICNI